ncbi:hypothetical protein MPL3356_540043 [Mesorhizobium plurifarium]|uniref:Uncharacterized protein n=1 Tax=Mesorhizobium plurifarium TaxID=69974 RepID=A0A090GUE1_MESPL|nr:hypothetical protein MPL3356_540043 [Mesorhizobium plurifarium]CDX56121.1 hypothetical protein MPL3365_230049 [Mesorhizobium plurifarium]
MIVVPPRMCAVIPKLVEELSKDLRAALPGFQFQIVPDYIGWHSREFVVEADVIVTDAAVDALQEVLARYGDNASAKD